MPPADAETLAPQDRAVWRRWLARHHERPDGVWLLIAKKGAGTGVSYEEAIREALCFGWIDSTAGSHDEQHYKLWMGPRKPKSGWSAVNKQRLAELEAEGMIEPAGRAAIELAKRNGSWASLDASIALEVPEDLAAAFRRHKGAKANWDAFPPSTKRVILEWIRSAKRDETRAKRIEETASKAAVNVRAR
jgi:uncharacterized protein YdeI (YjbR/CyaY-like superfamily)